MQIRKWTALAACVLAFGIAVPATAADGATFGREIIPGSELMTPQEREQYRLRLRGAKTDADRERLRGEHMKQIRERARLQGLEVRDYSAERRSPESGAAGRGGK